jgi:hypothetical protein
MNSATIGTTAQIDSALRRAFSDASVRVRPETKMTDVLAALTAMGLTVSITDGVLLLAQDQTQMNTSLALRNFSKQHPQFFILETSDPKTWTQQKKIEFIRQNGNDAYGKLCCAPVIEAGIRVLDVNMSKTDYLNLTRAERICFIREFGSDAVARVMQ